MSVHEHKSGAPKKITFSVITVSDRCSRGESEDLSGNYIVEELSRANTLLGRYVVPDEMTDISSAVKKAAGESDCVVLTGGTGVARRDVTIESVRPLLDKEIVGFGELFRRLSHDEVGTASIMSGAMGGVMGGSVVFCLPGSLPAVRLGMGIIMSEAHHIIKHLRD
ncbi:MAG TPA: MogA/MoaB family molybdenum cofactor biosynthesis protein [Candidatus Methanofastidiosa archaeon]|nr:MogA/MoaB family molybdenum cofactor biosynthesis protein [Candidatus Methanofastidiosa archaeon]HPR41434.1 MogA/MoaB family molybdenum cofactor biosynthesis protein [Candidatus Methanofastidiosa archaeon]